MLRYIDLFCGLGAFHAAFTNFQCVMACDINEGVRKLYKRNYNIEPLADICDIDIDAIPEFDIVCAGFPCQPFSIAGNGAGFADIEKGNLFFKILDIIDVKKPKMCILENVKNLKTHDRGKTYSTIQTLLEERGYTVVSKVINAAQCGSPQARQRIFIVATVGNAFEFPNAVLSERPVSAILDSGEPTNLIKYTLLPKKFKKVLFKPTILYDVISNATGRGGRQGERVYSVDSVGITVCASSGGPGAKTGLYKVGDIIRRLTVKETLGMFGFQSYLYDESDDMLFYLGNSIVVDVVKMFVPSIEEWFISTV